VLTSPPTRLTDPADRAVAPSLVSAQGEPAGTSTAGGTSAGMVTTEQVELAVLQLRERPGKSAVEQMQAVLEALGLTVAPPRP
jgi:hypothetical protein